MSIAYNTVVQADVHPLQHRSACWFFSVVILADSPSRGGNVVVYVFDTNQLSSPTPFFVFLFFVCYSRVYFCLYGPFNCIAFHEFSRQLSAFSLCSSDLISGFGRQENGQPHGPVLTHHTSQERQPAAMPELPNNKPVLSNQVWLQNDQQFRKHNRNNSSLWPWHWTVNQFFCMTVWLMMLYYQIEFGCKRTSSLEHIVKNIHILII